MTDEDILVHFTKRPAFAAWWADWSNENRNAFFRIVYSTHNASLDWYHINAPRDVRCGRKKIGAIDASEVYMQIWGKAPFARISRESDRDALKVADNWISLASLADALDAVPTVLSRFSIGRDGYWPDQVNVETAKEADVSSPLAKPDVPINLILYGPPGTGKTWATAAKAVELCGEVVPNGRILLMELYRRLQHEGRIAFVTFHQNYSYEDFVEGLRPETGGEEDGSSGFRLECRPGIFREICALAEQARTRVGGSSTGMDLSGRRFWKMGQGAIGSQDDVYYDALANNYIALGWGGSVDWSDKQFNSFASIKAHWLETNPGDLRPSHWTQMLPFRCEMKPRDIVLVPYGNSALRAVAEVTGDYYYQQDAEGFYAQRRPVRWLLTPTDPLPLDTIIEGNFTMRTLYSIPESRVNISALTRLLPGEGEHDGTGSGDVVPEQFVLIIDEINRANISKVFGELITLLEPDKRVGRPNALTVTLPYSKKRDFGVPANLHIVGTMNTADRSIALLDTALRRRFEFQELMPRPDLLGHVEGIDLGRLLRSLNERIEYLFDREHQIGHADFIGCTSRAALDVVMRRKVIPLLVEYFYEDWSKVALVLGDDGTGNNGFLERRTLSAPPGLDSKYDASDRYRWSVRDKFEYGGFAAL